MPKMSPALSLLLAQVASPLGDMLVVVDDQGRLRALDWIEFDQRMYRLLRRHYGLEGASSCPAIALSVLMVS